MDFKRLLADTVILQYVDSEEVEAQMTRPKDPSMGDWCLPCFKFAGRFGKSPAELAKDIVSRIGGYNFLEKAEAVGPYVNFTLDKKTVAADVIERVLGEGDAYGGGEKGAGKTICIDYSSVNIAKPFHMGHMLNTSIGAALYRIYRALGYNVVGINHLGDWGTQFGKLIVAFKKWGDRGEIEQKGVRGLLDIYVKFHTEAKKCPELEDEARAWFKKIEDGDNEALNLFKWFKDITMKEVGRVYDRLRACSKRATALRSSASPRTSIRPAFWCAATARRCMRRATLRRRSIAKRRTTLPSASMSSPISRICTSSNCSRC